MNGITSAFFKVLSQVNLTAETECETSTPSSSVIIVRPFVPYYIESHKTKCWKQQYPRRNRSLHSQTRNKHAACPTPPNNHHDRRTRDHPKKTSQPQSFITPSQCNFPFTDTSNSRSPFFGSLNVSASPSRSFYRKSAGN